MSDDIHQYRKILEDSELSTTADLEFITKYITIYPGSDDTVIEVLFKVPINDVVTIDDDSTATVTTLQMSLSLSLDFDTEPYNNGLLLSYNFQPQDEDDEYAYESVINWFDSGNYDSELVEKLTDIGFSESAASDIDVDGIANDQIDYYAGGIAKEISDAFRFVLNQDANVILSKFGPAVLTTGVEFSANDIFPHKHTIIKFLLSDLKHKGPQSETVVNIVSKLRTLNINWPELDTIEQSMNAGKLTENDKDADINTASESVQLAAVQQNGRAIRYIKNPSESVQLAAVQQDGSTIGWIKNPTPEIQLATVQQNGWAIQWIENPSPAVQLAAVHQYGRAIQFIKNPSPELFADKKAKQSIIKYILLLMKQNSLKAAAGLVTKLRTHNVNWPELTHIEHGLNAGKLG